MSEGDRLELLTQTKEHFNRYIKQADQKSAVLISGHLAFIGLLFNSDQFSDIGCIMVLVLLFSSASILASIYTIFPRFSKSNSESGKLGNLDWRSVEQEDVSDYTNAVTTEDVVDGVETLAASNHSLSKILKEKYRWLRVSMIATGVTFVLSVLLFLL